MSQSSERNAREVAFHLMVVLDHAIIKERAKSH